MARRIKARSRTGRGETRFFIQTDEGRVLETGPSFDVSRGAREVTGQTREAALSFLPGKQAGVDFNVQSTERALFDDARAFPQDFERASETAQTLGERARFLDPNVPFGVQVEGLTTAAINKLSGSLGSDMFDETPTADFVMDAGIDMRETAAATATAEPISEQELTPTQQTIQDLIEQTLSLQEDAAGEAAFQAQKEQELGVPRLQKTVNDLNSQLVALKNERAAIPTLLRQAAEGQGVTAQIMGAQERKLIQDNALKSLAVSTQLEAARGNLSTALDQAERLTEAKYGPIRARIDANITNLRLIQNSPLFEAEEKRRAEEQESEQRAQLSQLEEAENIHNSIVDIATDFNFINNAPAKVRNEVQDLLTKEDLTTEDLIRARELAAPFFREETGTTPTEKPLSINQIEQFRRSFGWTPPLGFTQSQLEQYMADNPGATPEELEAGARQVAQETEPETTETTPKPTQTADQLISSVITGIFSASIPENQIDALHAKAKEAGQASFFKTKFVDVKNYLESIQDKIQQALDEGFSQEEIIEFLTQ